MKNFIEGLQKLLPWLAGLPVTPKIVISVIILLAATFILLLIWSPTTQIKETRNAAVPLNVHNKREPNADMKIGETGMISTLTVRKMVDYINNSAPFQRDDIAKNYLGLKVNWEGELWDVEKGSSSLGSGESVTVQLHPEPGRLYGIYFKVPIEKYPQFKIAQRGDLIGVSGRIIECSGAGIYVKLEVDDIIFHEK